MTVDFVTLRAANLLRQTEWKGAGQADIAFRALEVADECGEVAGAVKKLLRAQRGICGSTVTLEDIADEIGDTIISIDLLACELGLPELQHVVDEHWIERPPEEITLRIDKMVGELSSGVLRHIRNLEVFENSDPMIEDIGIYMVAALSLLESLAGALGIDAGRAVTNKFNKTSAKYGLTTTMGRA